MDGEICNVLIILIHQASCPLNDEVRLVLAIVLDVPSDMAEVTVLEVTGQELQKNGLASSRRAHK